MTASKAPRSIADIVQDIRKMMELDKAQGVSRIPVYVLTPKMIEEILNSEDQPDQGNKSRIIRDHAETTGQPVVDAPMSQDDPAANAPADDYEAQLRAEAEAYVQAGLARRAHENLVADIEQALVIASKRVTDARDFAARAPEQVFKSRLRINSHAVMNSHRLWARYAQTAYNQHILGNFFEAEMTNTQWLAFCRDVYLALQVNYQELLNTCTCGQDHDSEA